MREVAVITTGFFDGVHLGHRHVLETVVSSARERGEEAVVVTFWPHPRTVLQQDARDFRLLSSMEEKKALLHACGIDRVEVLPFDRSFAAMTAAEYLALLRDRFGATLVVMGYDNRIGSDMKTCAQLSEEGYSSQTVGCADPSHFVGPSLLCCRGWHRFERNTPLPTAPDSPVISSTQIRKALGEGRVEDANAMLGYEYGLYGVVVSGNQMGRTSGFPTANIQLYEPLKLVPANGVYAVDVELEEKVPPAILWHGTGEKYVPSIDKQGLIPKSRLYVHLSSDTETARKVGSRHGKPVIYEIDCRKMSEDGYRFYLSANGIWLTKSVPAKYMRKDNSAQ